MQTKNISLLLFILIFTGVALLGSIQVWAQIQINVTDDNCSAKEIDKNLCIEAFGYVVQVYVDSDTGNPTSTWPIVGDGGVLEFRYRGSVNNASECKGHTWNYFIQDMTACTGDTVDYIVDTDPPGAQLLLPGNTVPKCPDVTAAPGHNLLKLNPSLNCAAGNEVVFSFFAAQGTPTSLCNYSVVVTKKGCAGDYLLGPGCGIAGYTGQRTFFCGEDEIIVDFDQCSGEPTNVEMPGYTVCPTTVGDDDYPTLSDGYTPQHMGPGGVGAVFCMDPPPHIYFYNQKAWYGINATTSTCPIK